MNKNKYQSGFGHIAIILVVFVFATIGTLGYVYYRNFVEKKDDTSSDIVNKDTKDDADIDGDTSSNEKTLAISEWGVTGSYSGDDTLNYTIEHGYIVPDSKLFFTSEGKESCGTIEPISRYDGDTPMTSVEFFAYDDSSAGKTVADQFSTDGISTTESGIEVEHKNIDGYYYTYKAPVIGNWPEDLPEECKDSTLLNNRINSIHEFFENLKSL